MADAQRTALDPPEGELTLITQALVDRALAYSRQSPRQRVIQPFHKGPRDPLHRMLNAVQPGSYVRPHRHLDPPKAEAFIVLRGSLAFFSFSEDGEVRECVRLAADGARFGVDLVPGVFHSFIALEPDTLDLRGEDRSLHAGDRQGVRRRSRRRRAARGLPATCRSCSRCTGAGSGCSRQASAA